MFLCFLLFCDLKYQASFETATCRRADLSVVFFHHSLQIALVFLLFYRFALVVKFLASAKTEFDFHESVLKIDFERNERIPFLLDFAAKFVDFRAVEKKFSGAARVDVVVTAHFVGRDMRAEHKNFAVFDYDETVAKIDRALPYGFDLATDERNACLVGVLDEIVVIGFFVCCNYVYHTFII